MKKKLTLKDKVRKIINQHDPIRLIKIGCPVDEYEPEIRKIMPLLKIVSSREKFGDSLYSIFVEMFDKRIAGPKKDYKKLSEEIYELKNKTRSS